MRVSLLFTLGSFEKAPCVTVSPSVPPRDLEVSQERSKPQGGIRKPLVMCGNPGDSQCDPRDLHTGHVSHSLATPVLPWRFWAHLCWLVLVRVSLTQARVVWHESVSQADQPMGKLMGSFLITNPALCDWATPGCSRSQGEQARKHCASTVSASRFLLGFICLRQGLTM